MQLNDVELFLVPLPGNATALANVVVVRLETDSGLEGWGECLLPWRPEELSARREAILPTLAGQELFRAAALWLGTATDFPAPLRAGLSLAWADLIGRATGQPLCHLWGGLYREHIPIAVRLPQGPSAVIANWSRDWSEHGFYAQIVSSTGNPQRDLQVLRAVREAAGERVELRLEGANRFTLSAALELTNALASYELSCFLDPLADPQGLLELARQTSLPLGVSQGLDEPAQVLMCGRAGAVRYVLLDPAALGGLWAAKQAAIVAEACGMQVLLGCQPSLGLATAALLHLAACTPNCESAQESSLSRLEETLLREPLSPRDGTLAVPTGPGLGVEVDRAKLEELRLG